ncbi:MAG: hypothetical protein NTZ35_11320 [Ignavibacteriales bacterium]|nr:hypothetical protein [Ignavibacteriales bacterium]
MPHPSLKSLFSLAIFLLASQAFSQTIYLSASHEIYPFLKRMEARGLLTGYRDAAKPLSRIVLAKHLKTLEGAIEQMTEVERDEYEFLKGEFHYELAMLAGDLEPSEIRWHVISETFPGGIVNLEPNFRIGQTNIENSSVRVRDQGIKLYGYVFDDIGYYFNFVDSREVGSAINFTKALTPDPGVVPTKKNDNSLEYNATEAQLNFRVGAFNFSIEKMQNIWGLERNGNLTFSNKAPSYPQIKLRVPVTDWMDFIYLHADLNSNVMDSTRSYYANSSALEPIFREVDRVKYMAAHMIEFTPTHGVNVSLGESVIYSDKGPLLIYLIPVMFFKSAEHYNGDKDNVQWFANLDLNVIRNTNVYFSLFIDDLALDDILKPDRQRNYLGFTAGFQTYDVLLKNLELTAEYTRINPWVYTHEYPATEYTNNGYILGSWMGQNSDNIYLDLSYRPLRSVSFGGTMQVFRKGGQKDIYYQYHYPSQSFLYGPFHEERSVGFHARYQFVRDGFIDARVTSRTTNDEVLNLNNDRKIEFSVSARYGLW